jgi:hypothetical protein
VSHDHEHDALRDEFHRLRARTEEPGSVPDFGAMMARAKADAVRAPSSIAPRRRPRRALVLGGWATAALAAAFAGLLLVDRAGSDDEAFERLVASYATDVAGGAWASPTAALLDVPGRSLTRSMPAVGMSSREWSPGTAPRPEPDGRDS